MDDNIMSKTIFGTKIVRKALLDVTGCAIQYSGWPCGTCFFNISRTFSNADWQSLLYFRGDSPKASLEYLPKQYWKNINKIMRVCEEKMIKNKNKDVVKVNGYAVERKVSLKSAKEFVFKKNDFITLSRGDTVLFIHSSDVTTLRVFESSREDFQKEFNKQTKKSGGLK